MKTSNRRRKDTLNILKIVFCCGVLQVRGQATGQRSGATVELLHVRKG